MRPLGSDGTPAHANLHAAGEVAGGRRAVARGVRRGPRHRGRGRRGVCDPRGTMSARSIGLMRTRWITASSARSARPTARFSAATPLFPGPKYAGPQAERYRGARALAGPLGRLLLGLRHLHAGLPAGVKIAEMNTQARAELQGDATASRSATGCIARPTLTGRLGDAGRAARELLTARRRCGSVTRADDRHPPQRAPAEFAGRTFQRWARRHAAPPARRTRRGRVLPRLRRELLRAHVGRGRRGARAQRLRRDRAAPGLLRPAAAVSNGLFDDAPRHVRRLASARAVRAAGYEIVGDLDQLRPHAEARGPRDPGRRGRRPARGAASAPGTSASSCSTSTTRGELRHRLRPLDAGRCPTTRPASSGATASARRRWSCSRSSRGCGRVEVDARLLRRRRARTA